MALKQFKKWNLKQSNDILQNNHRLYAYVDEERNRAWKAALEWVLEINEETLMPSRYTIEKELGNDS